MSKYARSGENFARLVKAHRTGAHDACSAWRAGCTLPLRCAARDVAGWAAQTRFLPVSLRGRALKAWRALVYAEAL
jgi:hypothetical protein